MRAANTREMSDQALKTVHSAYVRRLERATKDASRLSTADLASLVESIAIVRRELLRRGVRW